MSKTIKNTRGHPQYFKVIITEKSRNFVGREFVFSAINDFINQYDKGYFTIIGEPGSGKSSIVAQYANNNDNLVYYNFDVSETRIKGEKEYIAKNRKKQPPFLSGQRRVHRKESHPIWWQRSYKAVF